jgi:hypothetical protein
VQCQAHEFPLCLDAAKPAQAELAEHEHVLDPAIRQLDDPLAASVRRLAFVGLQLGCHRRGTVCAFRIKAQGPLALAPQRHHQFAATANQASNTVSALLPVPAEACLGTAPRLSVTAFNTVGISPSSLALLISPAATMSCASSSSAICAL